MGSSRSAGEQHEASERACYRLFFFSLSRLVSPLLVLVVSQFSSLSGVERGCRWGSTQCDSVAADSRIAARLHHLRCRLQSTKSVCNCYYTTVLSVFWYLQCSPPRLW